ncbi:hypothetical protein AX16_008568 [Volvariella volvacea WC 439]|nr:hypothetical protein AX16_008568 [Volvariella volvacea WC 439]
MATNTTQVATLHTHVYDPILQDALRDEIDARLRVLDWEVVEARQLRSQRNQLAPIFRLPPELLSRITKWLVKRYHRRRWEVDNGLFNTVYGQHLALAGVCQRWREMILADHTLWTDIHTPYLALAPILIERSGASLLSFNLLELFMRSKELIDDALELVSAHRQRIGELTLNIDSYEDPRVSLLSEPAPTIRSLRLIIGTKFSVLPHSLFRGSAPCLTALSLMGVIFPWDMPLLYSIPQLQSLFIWRHSGSERPSWDQLIRILRSMPNLQELQLSLVLPSSTPPSPPPSVIPFSPHFECLRLTDSTFSCNSLLNCISFVNVPEFNIKGKAGNDTRIDLISQPWMSNLMRLLCNQSVSIYEILMISRSDFAIIDVTTRRSHTTPDLSFHWDLEEDTEDDYIRWIMSLLPLFECKRFTYKLPFTRREWESYVNRIPLVEYLEVSLDQEKFDFFLGSLLISCSNPASMANTCTPFPRLESLVLEYSLMSSEWERLCKVLKDRKDQGYGLRRLSVSLAKDWAEGRHNAIEQRALMLLGLEDIYIGIDIVNEA